jgi:hypothetical protein
MQPVLVPLRPGSTVAAPPNGNDEGDDATPSRHRPTPAQIAETRLAQLAGHAQRKATTRQNPARDIFFRPAKATNAPHVQTNASHALVQRLISAKDFQALMGKEPKDGEGSARYKQILSLIDRYNATPLKYIQELQSLKPKRGDEGQRDIDLRPYEVDMLDCLNKIYDLANGYVRDRTTLQPNLVSVKSQTKETAKQAASAAKSLFGSVTGKLGITREGDNEGDDAPEESQAVRAMKAISDSADTARKISEPREMLDRAQKVYLSKAKGVEASSAPVTAELGAGANNVALQINLNNELWVWKAEPKGQHSDASAANGIPEENTRGQYRAVATYRIDQLLRTGLVPKTQLAAREGQLGQIMEFKPGKSIRTANWEPFDATNQEHVFHRDIALKRKQDLDAKEVQYAALQKTPHGPNQNFMVEYKEAKKEHTSAKAKLNNAGQWMVLREHGRRVNLGNPALQQKLANLQILDLITGQLDRHAGNFLLNMSDDGQTCNGVVAIDNDISFGANTTDLAKEGSRGTMKDLPNHIDHEMAMRIAGNALQPNYDIKADGITETDIRLAVSDLLLPDELEALTTRFRTVKERCISALREGRVLTMPGAAGSVANPANNLAYGNAWLGNPENSKFGTILGMVNQELRAHQQAHSEVPWNYRAPNPAPG